MKSLLGEYYNIVMYTIFGLILVMSSYVIILNVHHYNALGTKVIVSELDNDYKKYKDNITKLDNNINTISDNDNMKLYFSKALAIFQKDGLFRILPQTKLEYGDLYKLNTYFIDEIINNCWVITFQNLEISKKYQNIVDYIISNARYIDDYLSKDSLILYESNNKSRIINDYHMILNNYAAFSDVILDISNSVIGGNSE